MFFAQFSKNENLFRYLMFVIFKILDSTLSTRVPRRTNDNDYLKFRFNFLYSFQKISALHYFYRRFKEILFRPDYVFDFPKSRIHPPFKLLHLLDSRFLLWENSKLNLKKVQFSQWLTNSILSSLFDLDETIVGGFSRSLDLKPSS